MARSVAADVYLTLNGDAIVGDAKDEGAPLIKLEFCSEFKELSDDIKLKVAAAAFRALGEADGNSRPQKDV